MTTFFYAPPACFRDGHTVVLPEDEALHAIRVLRKKAGDEIEIVDGEGGWYRVRLDVVDRRRASGTVLDVRQEVGESAYKLSIGLALLKNRNRFEVFLEKAVELGVTEIVPLITQRTEKESFKPARAHGILVAAMKQCGRSRLVQMPEPKTLDEYLAETTPGLGLIAHEQTSGDQGVSALLSQHPAATSISILIGPEGGFTEAEVQTACEAQYHPVSLGRRRLRAETAALVAAAAVLLHRD